MSRCFPFPPPGYEKKAKIDDVDLLKKEKHREKKHKKEKNDKEKKESKEKRDKEGRDGKHKEKKNRKEKHRDKKKDKDKDRDKEKDKDKNKNSTADEKGFTGQAEGPNAVKLHQKEIKQKDEKIILSEEEFTKRYAGHNGDKARENNHLAEENKDSKFVKELGRRIKNEDGGVGNQFFSKFTITDQKKDEGSVRLVAKNGGTWPDGKEKLKGIDPRKIDGQGIRADVRPSGNATVQNYTRNFHTRVDGTPRCLEKNSGQTVETTVEGKEKGKEKKDDKRGDKRKDKDKEKKGHGKDKDRDKEKKKEKVKEQTEHKYTQPNKLKENNKGGLVGTNSFVQVSRDIHEIPGSGENLKKRKDIESNGVLHANDNWPSKLPRPSSSSNPFTENGRILEPCQISIPYTSDRPGAATHLKVDNKERKINGVIEAARPSAVSSNKTTNATALAEARPSAVSSNKASSATVLAEPKAEASAKPPHPDSKYLSQVYSVPKLEEWSGFDDQEWLFGSSSLQKQKPKVECSKIGETPLVWAEALHMEAADVCALPYVIPY